MKLLLLLAVAASTDPTFLHRRVADLRPVEADVSTAAAQYRAVFGASDRILRGVARFGELTIAPGGRSARVSYAREEQVYVFLEGAGTVDYGGQAVPVRPHDYLYLPPGVTHSAACSPHQACRVLVMGFKIPERMALTIPPKPLLANIDDVPKQTVGGHPPSTLYQLLMGDTRSTRDRISAGHVLTSLFVMEFAAGGTNLPHHHDREEEIYLVLDGHGEMVAGGGAGGVEGRYPAQAGDAYFLRLNTTVGFYAGNKEGEPKAHILAVRSLYPFGER